MRNNQQRLQGFTLVELIVVILLVSILSAYAASRYSGVSSVSAFAAREQAISIIRQIQLDRMQSNFSDSYFANLLNSENKYALSVSSSCLGSVAACAQLSACNDDSCRNNIVSKRSDILYNQDLRFSTSPVMSEVQFDLKGNPDSSADVSVTISPVGSNNSTQLCINRQGYVAKEDC